METDGVLNYVLGFAGAILWSGSIILVFAAWVGKIWADIWMKKERQLYQDEIEEYKSLIANYIGMFREELESENAKYITRAQFETESVLYQKLSETGLELVEAIKWLFPAFDELPKDEIERKRLLENRYDNAVQKYNVFVKHLGKSAPFINREIYYKFDILRKDSHHQILFFPDVRIRKDGDVIKAKSSECYANTETISDVYQKTMGSLREYLSSQKILE